MAIRSFYPVLPGSDVYAIGSPSVQNTTLQLENGNQFVVNTVNQSKKNVYVDKVELNGNVLINFTLKHSEIMNGGEITFYMSDTQKK